MAKKYYVVWKGAETGVFDNWPKVQALVSGRADAQYMGFESKAEADAAFASTYTKALMKRSLSKSKSAPSAKSGTAAPTPANSPPSDVAIYCDGACSPNPGKAGTGIAVYEKDKLAYLMYGLYDDYGTNNTAELNGLLEAFKLAEQYSQKGLKIEILSDSKYSIDCVTKWATGWKNKGWKKADGSPIKNPELVQQCYDYYLKLRQHITITHVRGHADIEGNELADRMAVQARIHQQTSFIKFQGKLDIKEILAMPSG
ncbi:ribonuclease H family protein [Thalassotalea fusca]